MTDSDILKYKAKYLTPLSVTTSTIAYDSDLRISYEDLSKYVKSDNKTILAVKSTCLPLEECINGGSYTKAKRILKRRARNKQKRGSEFSKPSRTLSGNQLYFQSSVEFVHTYTMPDNDYKRMYSLYICVLRKRRLPTDLIMIISKYLKIWTDQSYHNVRISPARGSIQIQGVKEPVFETAEAQILDTIKYIKNKMCIDGNYKLFNRRVIIVNMKSGLKSEIRKNNIFIKVEHLSILMNNLMEKQKNNKPLPFEIPYRIIFVTNPHEAGSYIRVKFITPIPENINRKTTIKVFSGCKINFLGSPTLECPYYIYKFLDEFIDMYKNDLLYQKEIFNELDSIDNYITNIQKHKYTWVSMIKNNIIKPKSPV